MNANLSCYLKSKTDLIGQGFYIFFLPPSSMVLRERSLEYEGLIDKNLMNIIGRTIWRREVAREGLDVALSYV